MGDALDNYAPFDQEQHVLSTAANKKDENEKQKEMLEMKILGRCRIIKGYYLRMSWIHKKEFILSLLRNITCFNTLLKIISYISTLYGKMAAYTDVSPCVKSISQQILGDHDRGMQNGCLKETACEDINWIATLTKQHQMNIVVDLMSLGGGGLLRKLYIPIVIIYNKKVLEAGKKKEEYGDIDEQYFEHLFNDVHFDDSDKYPPGHPLSIEVEKMRKKWDEMMAKLRSEVFGWSEETLQNNAPESGVGDKKSKTQTEAKTAKSTAKSSSKKSKHSKHGGRVETDTIDWFQMLPIWIVKKIFGYLDQKTLNKVRQVNSYWSYASKSILNDRQARASLDKSIMKMRRNIDPQILRQFDEHPKSLEEYYSPGEKPKLPNEIRFVKLLNRGSILKQMVPVVDESQLVQSNILTTTIRKDKEIFSPVDSITVFPRLIREDLLLYKYKPGMLKDVNLVIDVTGEIQRQRMTLSYSLSELLDDAFSMSDANLADW